VLAGLGPGLAWHGATATALNAQPLRLERLYERPMTERLFYERGHRKRFDEFAACARAFLAARGMKGPAG
jgi:hypothetical protein